MNALKQRARRPLPSPEPAREQQAASVERSAEPSAQPQPAVCHYCCSVKLLDALYEPYSDALRCRDVAACQKRMTQMLTLPQDVDKGSLVITPSSMRHALRAQGAAG